MLPPQRVYDLLPDDPGAPRVDAPDYRALFPDIPPPSDASRAEALPDLVEAGWASNAWAVSGARSASGAPLVANDPHLDLTAPAIWYLARLSLRSGDVIGATIPGIPAILSGRNQEVAWGITAANVDDQDVVIERLDPADGSKVLTATGSVPIRRQPAEIVVKGEAAIALTLEWTGNGPVIPSKFYNLSSVTPPGHIAVITRTIFDPADTTYTAALALMRARSVDEMIAAGRDFVAPAVNVTAADADHIVLQTVGHVPWRDIEHPTLGRMPAPGWLTATPWKGVQPYDTNPRILDPASGAVGNTNDRIVTRAFPDHVSLDWGDTERTQRLAELLSASERHTELTFRAMQGDIVSPPARRLIPLLLSHAGPAEGIAGEAHALLADWDGTMAADRAEPLIYTAWIRALHDALISDLGPLKDELTRVNPVFLTRVLEDTEGAATWCAGSCPESVRASRDAALNALTSGGKALSDLRWGEEHLARHDHPVLGSVPIVGCIVNIRHSAGGGDDTLMRGLTSGHPEHPFDNVHASGYRSIHDPSEGGGSLFIVSTGQSGHPLSRHYRDQNRLWREGDYLPIGFEEITPDRGGTHILHLIPAP